MDPWLSGISNTPKIMHKKLSGNLFVLDFQIAFDIPDILFEFFGMVADTPEQPVELKAFCCRVINDPEALGRVEAVFEELPVVREVTDEMLMETFMQVRREIEGLVEKEMERMGRTPELRHSVIE
jgi:hypothetical protein